MNKTTWNLTVEFPNGIGCSESFDTYKEFVEARDRYKASEYKILHASVEIDLEEQNG